MLQESFGNSKRRVCLGYGWGSNQMSLLFLFFIVEGTVYSKELLCFMILFNMFKTDELVVQSWAQLFKTIDIVRQQDVNP